MAKKKRILLVDDEPHIVEVVKFRLELNNYEVIPAYTGKEGLEKAAGENPDLILLDVMMPKMSGYSVATKLKSDKKTKSTPIIMFTAKGRPEEIAQALKAGGDDCIVKPYEPEELLKKIKKLLNKK